MKIPNLDLRNVLIFENNLFSHEKIEKYFKIYIFLYGNPPPKIIMTIEQVTGYIEWLRPEEMLPRKISQLSFKGSKIEI